MALCQYCEDIDPDAIWKTDMGNPEGCPRVDYELQRSTSMRFSAQKGCPGCRFFLDVIRQDPSDAKAVDEALHRDERIWIQAPFLLTINVANNRTRLYDLDLCLGKGTVPPLQPPSFLGAGADPTHAPMLQPSMILVSQQQSTSGPVGPLRSTRRRNLA